MDWFAGGVVDAISACRRDKCLFLVYVHDDSGASSSTTESWNSGEVQSALSGNQMVAIKISKGSLGHQQFSQLYSVFIFPSTFCIGLTGKPLVVMNGQQSALQIKEKLNEAFEKLRGQLETISQLEESEATPTQPEAPPTQSPDNQPTNDSVEPASQSLSSQPPPPGPSVENEAPQPPGEGSVDGRGAEGGTGVVTQQDSREERIARAEEKVRQKRLEREEAHFQKEKSVELKRREEGKHTAESRKDLEDVRNQTWIQERKKAKEEERAAREAIRAKLRQDRMERESQKRAREQQQQASSSEPRHRSFQSSPMTTTTNGVCRLQLRLPTGDKSVIEMRAEDTLGSFRERVAEEVGVAVGGVALSSAYPREELSGDKDDKTLTELGLAPSGVVLVRFSKGPLGAGKGGGSGSGGGGGLWGLIVTLFQMLLNLLGYLKRLCGFGSDETGGKANKRNPKESYVGGRGGGRERVRKFQPGEFEENSSEDDEEKRNTYNGNSTEQQ